MKTSARIFRRFRHSSAPLFTYYFIYGVFIAPMAFLATYITKTGIPSSQLSILMALRPIAMIIGQFIWGEVADRAKTINSVHMLLLIGTTVSSASFLFIGGFWGCAIGVTAFYFFYSSLTPLLDCIALNNVSRGLVGNYGNVRLMLTIGYSAALAITGRLNEGTPDAMFYVMLASGLLCVLTFLMVERVPGERKKGMKFNSAKFFAQGKVLLPLCVYLVLQFVYAFFDVIFPVYLSINLNAGDGILGYSLAARTLGEFFVLPFIGWISKKVSFRNAISLFMVLSALRFIICIFTTNSVVMILISLLSGCGNIGAFTWLMMHLNSLAPPEGKATVQSQMYMLFSVVQVLGNLCVPLFMPDSNVGITPVFFIYPAAAMTLGAFVYWLFGPKGKPYDIQRQVAVEAKESASEL